MNPNVSLVLAGVAAALACGPAAGQEARMTSTSPGPTVVVSSYWGYAPRPYGVMSGFADIIEKQGEFLVKDAQARLMREQVRQQKLETRRRNWEHWRWEEEFLHNARLRHREIGEEQKLIAALDASNGSIYSGRALNDLAEILWKQPNKLSGGKSGPIPAAALEHVNFTMPGHEGCSTGLLRAQELTWPYLLQLSPFKELSDQADRQFVQLREQARATGAPRAEDLQDLMKTLDALGVLCSANSRDGALPAPFTPSDFIAANRFVKDLRSAAWVLRSAPKNVTMPTLRAATVVDLLTRMKEGPDGVLLFAPAMQGDERYYRQLHAALAQEVRQNNLEPRSRPATP